MISREELGNLIDAGKNTKECCDILKISIRKLKELRKEYGFNRVYLNFKTNCGFCGKSHEYVALKEKDFYYCSISCANKNRKHSDDTKIKISKKLKSIRPKRPDRYCPNCGININNKRIKNVFCSKQCSSKFINGSEEQRKKQSEIRINYLNKSNINWIETINISGKLIKVQGRWEEEFAKKCNQIGILYERKSISITNVNKYTPDFYLPNENIYIEIKGYLYDKDKYKMLMAVQKTKIDLRIIFDIKEILNLDYKKICDMSKVQDIIKFEDIDFSKFIKRF